MDPFNVFYNVQTLDILRWNTTSAGQRLTLHQKVSTPVGCTPVCLRPPRRVCLRGTRGVGVIWLPTHNAHVSYMPDLMRVGGGWQTLFVMHFYEGGHVLTSAAAHFIPDVC